MIWFFRTTFCHRQEMKLESFMAKISSASVEVDSCKILVGCYYHCSILVAVFSTNHRWWICQSISYFHIIILAAARIWTLVNIKLCKHESNVFVFRNLNKPRAILISWVASRKAEAVNRSRGSCDICWTIIWKIRTKCQSSPNNCLT